jgi:hypothetical protein
MPPNILQLQREVESLPDERLLQEAQMPNMFPAYLTQQEMVRREQERNAYQSRKAQQPTNTVHDRLIERAMSGIGSIPQQLSPEQEMFARQSMMDMSPEQMMQQQIMMQSPMPQPMADGGLVGYHEGGDIPPHPHDSRGRHYGDESRLVGERPEWVLPGSLLDKVMGYEDAINVRGRDFFNRSIDVAKDIFTPSERSYVYGVPTWGIPGMEPQEESLPQRYSYEAEPRTDWSMVDAQIAEGQMPSIGGPSSIPSATGSEGEGIASLIASMQAPVFGRQAMDVSEYYEMTPEDRRLLEFYGSKAQSLESRIDTESDKLSARANILSNVSRAMARGQVPTAGEPLRELQTAQRSRREGIMDESRAMEMAALAQEAGLSRAKQEALRDRAMVEDERAYQEDLREKERQRFNQYVAMSQSDNPDVKAIGSYHLQRMGITSRGELTQNAAAQINARALSDIDEFVEQLDTEDIASALRQINTRLAVAYGEQPIPRVVRNAAIDALNRVAPEEFAAYMTSISE